MPSAPVVAQRLPCGALCFRFAFGSLTQPACQPPRPTHNLVRPSYLSRSPACPTPAALCVEDGVVDSSERFCCEQLDLVFPPDTHHCTCVSLSPSVGSRSSCRSQSSPVLGWCWLCSFTSWKSAHFFMGPRTHPWLFLTSSRSALFSPITSFWI